MTHEERRRCGNRLCWPRLLAAYVAGGEAPLLDRPDRLTSDAVEHVQKSGLSCLRHDIDRLPVASDGGELGRGRVVVVPEVVVHHLEVPQSLPRTGIQREQRGAEQIRAMPVA